MSNPQQATAHQTVPSSHSLPNQLLTAGTSSSQLQHLCTASSPILRTTRTDAGTQGMRRCGGGGIVSSPLGALAVVLLLLVCSLDHAEAAARVLHAVPALVPNQANGAMAGIVLRNGAGVEDDELPASAETTKLMVGAEEDDAVACAEEGKANTDAADECLQQRRLLRDAHLDYIYTQHKGKP